MNKKGLIGKLIILLLAVIIILGVTIYVTLSRENVRFSAGKVTLDVGYDFEDEDAGNGGGLIEEVELNETLEKLVNSNNETLNETELSS